MLKFATWLYWTIFDKTGSLGGQNFSQSAPPFVDLKPALLVPVVYMTRGSTVSISKTCCTPPLSVVLLVPVLSCFQVVPQFVDFHNPWAKVPK